MRQFIQTYMLIIGWWQKKKKEKKKVQRAYLWVQDNEKKVDQT